MKEVTAQCAVPMATHSNFCTHTIVTVLKILSALPLAVSYCLFTVSYCPSFIFLLFSDTHHLFIIKLPHIPFITFMYWYIVNTLTFDLCCFSYLVIS